MSDSSCISRTTTHQYEQQLRQQQQLLHGQLCRAPSRSMPHLDWRWQLLRFLRLLLHAPSHLRRCRTGLPNLARPDPHHLSLWSWDCPHRSGDHGRPCHPSCCRHHWRRSSHWRRRRSALAHPAWAQPHSGCCWGCHGCSHRGRRCLGRKAGSRGHHRGSLRCSHGLCWRCGSSRCWCGPLPLHHRTATCCYCSCRCSHGSRPSLHCLFQRHSGGVCWGSGGHCLGAGGCCWGGRALRDGRHPGWLCKQPQKRPVAVPGGQEPCMGPAVLAVWM